MFDGFGQLAPEFFAEVLTRRRGTTVRVRSVDVAECPGLAGPTRRAEGLQKVDLQTTMGPLSLIVKRFHRTRQRGALVWRFLEAAGGLPLPELFHVESDEKLGRFGVILEYVEPPADPRSWDAADCRLVGSALARLHGPFWGRVDKLPALFPIPEVPPEAAVESTVRRFLDEMPERRQLLLHTAMPAVFTFLARLLRMGREFFDEPAGPPKTLIHGALDCSEVLLRRDPPPTRALLIDWEDARVGRGTEDLASLINALPPADRPANAESIVSAYVEGLDAFGAVASAGRLVEEVKRQRILHAARNLPRLCTVYAENPDDPEYAAWRADFEQTARHDAAEMRKLLADFAPPAEMEDG